MDRVGLFYVDRPTARDQAKLAKYAEDKGFEGVWICETRLARDAVSILGAAAYATEKIKLGSAVINPWTRSIALIALTWATLDELSNGRAILGLGAYWDPLAWKQGITRRKHLTAMRECVTIVRRLLNLERVDFEGEVFQVRDLKLDLGWGVPQTPKKVPIYVGATGLRMMEVAGEIGDGVLMNFFVSTDYNKKSVEQIKKGAAKSGRKLEEIDRPQLIAVAMDEDGDKARNAARAIVTMYLGQQPHIMKASGLSEKRIEEIQTVLGGWPPKKGGVEEAMRLVDNSVVNMLSAAGTPDECRKKVKAYVDSGCTCPLICPITDNIVEMIDTFAEGYS
ncbi:MAG: LLM class flavin-dependent oxidoreductase [Candidatus Bathyarchaeia archaeon]